MEQSAPDFPVSSELVAGQLPSNKGLHDVQQVTTHIHLLHVPRDWLSLIYEDCFKLVFILL